MAPLCAWRFRFDFILKPFFFFFFCFLFATKNWTFFVFNILFYSPARRRDWICIRYRQVSILSRWSITTFNRVQLLRDEHSFIIWCRLMRPVTLALRCCLAISQSSKWEREIKRLCYSDILTRWWRLYGYIHIYVLHTQIQTFSYTFFNLVLQKCAWALWVSLWVCEFVSLCPSKGVGWRTQLVCVFAFSNLANINRFNGNNNTSSRRTHPSIV